MSQRSVGFYRKSVKGGGIFPGWPLQCDVVTLLFCLNLNEINVVKTKNYKSCFFRQGGAPQLLNNL